MKISFNNHIKLLSVLTLGFFSASNVDAAAYLREGMIEANLLVVADNSVTEACGFYLQAQERASLTSFEGAIHLSGYISLEKNVGSIKGRTSDIVPKTGPTQSREFKLEAKPTENFWLKARNSKQTFPSSQNPIIRTDKDGFISYMVDKEVTYSIINAVMNREPIQIGAKVAGANHERALFGIVTISDLAISELKNCLNELEVSQ